jgi:MFS family permease
MNAITAYWRELTLKPQGIIIVIAAFLPIIAIVAMGPAVPSIIKHFANDPNARGAVPAMIGAPGLAMALIAPFAGWLVDKFGRRQLLLCSTLLYGFAGSAPYWLDSLDQIYYSRLVLGVSEAGILTTVNTLIGDYWDDKGRKNWLFLQGLLGPFISGFVMLIVGYTAKMQWNGVFLVYLIAFPIWAAMLVWLFEPKKSVEQEAAITSVAPATAFPWGPAAMIAGVTFFFSMLYYVFIINGALVFAEVGVTDSRVYAGLLFVPQLFILVGAVVFRLLANRGHALQLGTALVLLGGGLAGMGLATTVPLMVAALIVQQTAAGMTVPTLISWVQSKFGFEHRGRAMGIWTAAFFLAQSQSPRLVHVIDAQLGSMQGAFLLAGIVGLGGAVVALGMALRGRAARA